MPARVSKFLPLFILFALLLPLSGQCGRDGGNGPRVRQCAGERSGRFLTTNEKRDPITVRENEDCVPSGDVGDEPDSVVHRDPKADNFD